MPSPNIPRIATYLSDRPDGATIEEIAKFLDTHVAYAKDSLSRMEDRFEVRFDGGLWFGTRPETPPVFHAMEILHAMQQAALRSYA